MSTEKITPLMQQYFAIKAQYEDTLLFFQVGDFYELFFDDAKIAAQALAIALTKRGKNQGEDIPLCGIPVHALNYYLTKLIKAGHRVALCQQLTKPIPGQVVERGITHVFTPATLTESSMLQDKSASYLLSCYPHQDKLTLLFGELLTSQLFGTIVSLDAPRSIEAELARFFPDEIIIPKTKESQQLSGYFKKLGYYVSFVEVADGQLNGALLPEPWIINLGPKTESLITQTPGMSESIITLERYLARQNIVAHEQFKTLHVYQPDDYLIIDAATQRNLDIVQNSHDGSSKNTLLSVLDKAQTPMGSRTIKKWLTRPLVHKSAIEQRLEMVQALVSSVATQQKLEKLLSGIADLERIVGRIALGRALVIDYRGLRDSLGIIPEIKQLLSTLPCSLSTMLADRMHDFSALKNLLDASINDDPTHPYTIKVGFDHNLDHLFALHKKGKVAFLEFEQAEVASTNIGSLKVGFNGITGYYIEITNTHTEKIPERYQHVQTLANRKRFTTPELKQLEADLSRAEQELGAIEENVFARVKADVASYTQQLRALAQSIAYLDGLFGFAKTAHEFDYCRPVFHDNRSLIIRQGRHPIVEQATTQAFQANDLVLDDSQSTLIITGPNMGGKSTYLRQAALINLMAQCGSFVPAQSAALPILDRIFTRIGSGDNLAEGKSTFLVEMEETATICTQATHKSLVILDEVGRGTSTYDGMSLAQAILEHIHTVLKSKCLFATHYHELTALEEQKAGIKNYHLASKTVGENIIFLHTVLPGVAAGSFGLHVAKLAHVPKSIIARAQTLLNQHMVDQKDVAAVHHSLSAHTNNNPTIIPARQHVVVSRLASIDCNTLTPKQAFDLVWELAAQAQIADD